MSQSEQASEKNDLAAAPRPVSIVALALLGLVTAIIYGCLNFLSWQFTFDSVFKERPIIAVLLLFAAAFASYLAAIFFAKRAAQNGKLIGVIIGFALLFRVVMVFSYPIQEVDIYRYMWDGEVQTLGVSPFKFSPLEVSKANADTEKPDLKKLVDHREADPSVKQVLERVHIEYLPTIYPPTSQLVFRIVAMISPSGEWANKTDDPELQQKQIETAVVYRLWVMKAVLVAFDVGVLILLISLLTLCRMPVGLSVAYGWCPLVMKEVANSGHLDAIAVFLSVLAIYLLARLVTQSAIDADQDRSTAGGFLLSVFAALVLAAAVGAKIYPIVLAPLVFWGIARRFNWPATIVATIVFISATYLLVLPILPTGQSKADAVREIAENEVAVATQQLVAGEQLPAKNQLAAAFQLPAVKQLAEERRLAAEQQQAAYKQGPLQVFEDDPSAGLTKFIKEWEMNDFIYMVVSENLKVDPPGEVNSNKLPIWFSVVPQEPRRLILNPFLKGHQKRVEDLQQEFDKTQERSIAVRQKLGGLTNSANTEQNIAEQNIAERNIASIKAGIYQKKLENLWRQISEAKASVFLTPFKITRVLTSFVFLLIALWLAWRAGVRADSSDEFAKGRFYGEAAFLTLAWFWLLLPTQNPWYWLWALPFLPFVRNRAWLAVSGLVLAYYFRFWMEYHWTGINVWGTPYQGVSFFDFVLTWFEFAPWFLWLTIEGFARSFNERRSHQTLRES